MLLSPDENLAAFADLLAAVHPSEAKRIVAVQRALSALDAAVAASPAGDLDGDRLAAVRGDLAVAVDAYWTDLGSA